MKNKTSSNPAMNDPRQIYFPALEEVYFKPEPQGAGPRGSGEPQDPALPDGELAPHFARMRLRLLEASEFEMQEALTMALGMSRQTFEQRQRYLAHLRPRPWEESSAA